MNVKDLDKISELIANDEFSEAKVLLEDYLSVDEFNIEALKNLGLCNLNLELFDEARINFETVVKYSPEDASGWFYLANCYDNLDDFLHAKSAYLKVIELRENYTEAYKNLSIVYMKINEHQEAVKLGKKLIELQPDEFTPYFIVGTAYMALKDFKLSLEYLEKALSYDSKHAQLLNNLGTVYITFAQYDKAYEFYEKASAIEPDNSITFYNMASILQLKGNHKEACELFAKAYSLDNSDNYLVAMALSEFKSGDFENAVKHYKELATRYPEKSNFQYNLACCYEQMGNLKAATDILEVLLITNPKAVLMLQKLASIYMLMNMPENAKVAYEKIIMQGKVSPEIYHEYAIICVKANDIDTAERIFKKVLELNPNDSLTHKDLGVIYLSKRLFDYAEDEFKKALSLDSENPDIIFEYANFLHAISDFVEADKNYMNLLIMVPNNPEYLIFAAKNKISLNDNPIAYNFLVDALKQNPNNQIVLFLLGKVSYLMGDYENAKLYFVKSYELFDDAETENMLAMCYFNLGNFIQANQIFLKLLESNSNNTMLLLSSAKCYEQIGDKDKALEQLEKAVEIFPEFEEAHEMIRNLS